MKIKEIYDVVVDKISLVSKDKNPAVPWAKTTYAIFKIKKPRLTKEDLGRLEKIQENYKQILKN